MLSTVESMRMFCDGRMSVHDIYAILESIGHSRQDCVDAFAVLSNEPDSHIRVGSYDKREYHAELYLTTLQRSHDVYSR